MNKMTRLNMIRAIIGLLLLAGFLWLAFKPVARFG